MAKSRRRDDDDDDYEVVENPPPKKKKRPVEDDYDDAPRKKKRPVADDDGFEVVGQPPVKKKRSSDEETRPNRMADTRADDEFEVVDDEPPRKKKRPVEVDEDDEDDDRPRKKKKKLTASDKKRIRDKMAEEREEAKTDEMMEWAGPIFLTFLGVFMTVISGIKMTSNPDYVGLSIGLMLLATTVWTIILIPIVIVSLMIIGSIMGIEYGTLKNAVRSMVAITFLVNGIYWMGNWVPFLGFFLTPMIAGIVTFALFMSFFRLDAQETSTSLGILNIILFLSNIGFKILIVTLLIRGAGGGRGNKVPVDDFDEDDPPAMKQGANDNFGGGGKRLGKQKRPPVNFDDDE